MDGQRCSMMPAAVSYRTMLFVVHWVHPLGFLARAARLQQ